MADFGFVGTSYTAPSIYQDDQECINFFAEIDPTKQQGERGIVALYPTPGLLFQTQLAVDEVRGLHTMSGEQILIAVSGNKVYQVNRSMVATQIGTLTTSTGQVSISDNITNADGLIAYIVDGPNRYTWVVSTNTFTTLPSTDGPWQGANVVDVIDNYNIYNEPNSQNWACTDLSSQYSTQALYGSSDGSSDLLVTLITDRRQVYLLGEVTTEVWTDVGNVIAGITTFPFQRVPGTFSQSGIGARFSLARFADSFVCVCKDTRGDSTIEMMQGYAWVKISTHAVEQSLTNEITSDAFAYTYQIEGHEMYVCTFPSIGDGLTWVYDGSTKSWHKWLYWDSANAIYKRHRSNCGAYFNNMYIVGDYENGKLYSIENAVYTDDGATIRRLRRAKHLTTDLQRQYFEEFQIQFQPGVGLNVGQGQDPQAMLRWSNDGGSTWSNEHWVTIGKIGNYLNRAIWRRLGWARDRIFEVVLTDPIKAVIVSANLKASAGDN
jgi:Phage stabilisation protein